MIEAHPAYGLDLDDIWGENQQEQQQQEQQQENNLWKSNEIKAGEFLFIKDPLSKNLTYKVQTQRSENNPSSRYQYGMVVFEKNKEGIYEPHYYKNTEKTENDRVLIPTSQESLYKFSEWKRAKVNKADFENIVGKICEWLNHEAQVRKNSSSWLDPLWKKEFEVVSDSIKQELSDFEREVRIAFKIAHPKTSKKRR